ncbi:Frequency clock protein [Tolypocladium ophioglossoides CBS 100239]|uniref:Frequency clock protein n=1 Tax=Tolypocladium ophioglossoides (strain CBS 100239) TaxID=1163406 RepID=A0A0L0N6D2_TOLOC|nr:Frequency clock protein [Tolypocladium ophioglossoides CBS 100239]
MKNSDLHDITMPSPEIEWHGTQPPPLSPTGHPLPRRNSAANSVTLRHHQLARDASLRANPGSGTAINSNTTPYSPRRNSTGDSHETGQSDPKNWFDQSNEHPTATFDNNAMDVDPPFFQRESDLSNEDRWYPYQRQAVPPRLDTAQSSSADDYRSVIDDLTVEIQKLKEELKRYRQQGPDMLRKDKLFEIKIHGLSKRKKRELETTLRDFAASLEDPPDASSLQQKKASRHANRDHMYSASGSPSKPASSSSGSNIRPVDSAYASMSTGAHSSATSLGRPHNMSSRVKTSEQKVESYLRDIPEGLYPRHMAITDKDKKTIVVRRLEQLFTGKIGGRHARRSQPAPPPAGTGVLAPVIPKSQPQGYQQMHQPPPLATAAEPTREAKILPLEQPSGNSGKKSASRDNASTSQSDGDQTESNGNGNSSGSGTNTSPSNMPPPPDQRPTRPKDLDPDRVQVPSENMEYIRHLGLVPPELLTDATKTTPDVHHDAEGWVYLNLLCNMAQLHMINVTPSFVRAAVSGISTKFQLSPDGRKIRWRGGSEGTKFSSDKFGDNHQGSPDTDDTTGSNKGGSRKRQKTGNPIDEFQSGSAGQNVSKFGPQISGSSASFHYKPLFVQQESPNEQASLDDTLSSLGPAEDSNLGESRWRLSGSETYIRRKRCNDGAIIYYSGAPFCTDLSGDPGDLSPAIHMLSSGQDRQESFAQFARPLPCRSESGSSLSYRPLRDGHNISSGAKMDVDSSGSAPELTADSDDDSSELDFDLPWANEQQYIEACLLEPCGLGGVLPDDHFMVVVTTKRPKEELRPRLPLAGRANADEATDGIISRLATMSTSSPVPLLSTSSSRSGSPAIEIEYVSGRIKRLAPVPLPPPAVFFPPFSTDTSSDWDDDLASEGDDDGDESSEELKSRQANPHQSDGYPDGVDLASGDDDGEDPESEPDTRQMYDVDFHNWGGPSRDNPARAGAAGSSAAYHLQKYAEEEGLAVNITLFEKTDRIGGRTLTVNAFDDPQRPVELGASIFVAINHILFNATQDFGLPLAEMSAAEAGDITAIWDGNSFVFQSAEGTSWWWDAGKLWWRYGLSPYKALNLVKSVIGTFLKLYEEPYFPFRSLTQRAFELGLVKITGVTGEQFLAENSINVDFSQEVIQPATRVNYASNLAYIHGLETMVSFATEGAVAVAGGNWQIFDKMVHRSGAALYRNTSVTSISFDKGDAKPGVPRKYLISTQDSNAKAAEAETIPTAFDNVIIASPWQFSDIDAGESVIKHRIDKIPYTKLHVTLFTSPFKLHAAYFNLEPGSKAPSNVYTTLGKDEEPKQGADGVGRTGFYSISTLRTTVNPQTQKLEFLYKIFSAEAVTSEFLSNILGVNVPSTFVAGEQQSAAVEPISWYHPAWFYSYPVGLPRVTFQDPIVGRGLYYTSGIESFISTMETSALMGMNVARLIADDFAGVTSRGGKLRGKGGKVLRKDFFESLESEMGVSVGDMAPVEL